MATDLIAGYLAHLREASSSARTVDERGKTLHRIHRDLPYGLDVACTDELREWLWRDGLSQGSRETYYSAIKGFFTWAVKANYLDFNPAEELIRPKTPKRLPRPITDEELQYLLAHCVEPYRLWVLLAAYGGLRCLEISRLRREHINRQTMTLPLGKGDKPRGVPTHPAVWEAVRNLPRGPVSIQDARYISIRFSVYASRDLRMPGVTLHRCRHWFGTNVQRLYKNLRVTQALLGHADPRTTAGYAAITDEESATAISLLPNFSTDEDDDGPEPGRRPSR